jgi:hypothetical protein
MLSSAFPTKVPSPRISGLPLKKKSIRNRPSDAAKEEYDSAGCHSIDKGDDFGIVIGTCLHAHNFWLPSAA